MMTPNHSLKRFMRLTTVTLFCAGAFAAGVLVFQQYAGSSQNLSHDSLAANSEPVPDVISRARAINIAMSATNWDNLKISEYSVNARLVHVKQNGFTFVVDDTAMKNTWVLTGNVNPDLEDDYIWQVKLVSEEQYRNAGYSREVWINAATSNVILTD